MKKRVFTMAMTVVLLLSVLTVFAVPASAACTATVTVASVSGQKGDVVEVPITITQNSGLVNGDMFIRFDTTMLALDSTYYPDPEGDETDTLCYKLNTSLLTSGFMCIGAEKEPGVFYFAVATGSNTGLVNGGEMIRLAFRILTDDIESTEITFEADPFIGNDGSGESDDYGYPTDGTIDLTIVNGMVTIGSGEPDPGPEPVMKGDMNGDGTINMIDAMLLYTGVSRGTLTDEQKAIGDISGDGIANMVDAMFVYRIAAGM